MSARRLSITTRIPFLLCLFCVLAVSTHATDRGLLVGVSSYPNLEQDKWLLGPTNDVDIVTQMLCSDRFGFDRKHITILAGWPDDKTKRPTKANIQAAFADLAKLSGPGDTCFILMSGHGSLQPANEDLSDIENDGFDEVFIPADVGKWDDTAKAVKNAIVDDEVREWVAAIVEKGAFVWIVFDSCHSGTMTRELSLSGRVARQLSPDELIPASVLAAAQSAKPMTRGFGTAKAAGHSGIVTTDKGTLVAMYAAQSLEPTFELPIPTPVSRRHGIFTYSLVSVLSSMESDMTFAELADTIQTLYLANGVFQPTPLIEGSAINRSVLGGKEIKEQPVFLMGMQVEAKSFALRAGSIHGLKKDTVLEVFPPAGVKHADKPLGFVRVDFARPFSATVVPYLYKGTKRPAVDDLGYGCRCKVVYEPFGAAQLCLAIQQKAGDKLVTLTADNVPAMLKSELDRIADSNQKLFTTTDNPAEANWFLRIEGDSVVMIPASGWSPHFSQAKDSSSAPPAFRVASIVENTLGDSSIDPALRKIARVRQLLGLASQSERKKVRGNAIDIQVELLRYADGDSEEGEPVKNQGGGRTLRNGDTVAFKITNPSTFAVDVTLLFVDSSFGVTSIFPESGTVDDNRLAPKQVFTTEPMVVTAETVGLEQIVAIGVRATSDRQNFACLEQSTLERIRGERGMDSALGQLLKTTVYGEGDTRGLAPSQSDMFKMRLISWFTQP